MYSNETAERSKNGLRKISNARPFAPSQKWKKEDFPFNTSRDVCVWVNIRIPKKKGQDNVAPSYSVWLGVWQIQSFQLYNLFKLNWPTSELVEGKKNEGFTGAGAGFSPYWLSSCYMSISFPFERNKRKRHKGLVSILMPSMASIECNKNIVTGVFFSQSMPNKMVFGWYSKPKCKIHFQRWLDEFHEKKNPQYEKLHLVGREINCHFFFWNKSCILTFRLEKFHLPSTRATS